MVHACSWLYAGSESDGVGIISADGRMRSGRICSLLYISLLIRQAQRPHKGLGDMQVGRKARADANDRETGAQELSGASLLRGVGARDFSVTRAAAFTEAGTNRTALFSS